MPDNQIIFNNHIYSLYNDTLTWEEAKVHCEEIGGHLVTITNKEEQNVITDLLKINIVVGIFRCIKHK